MTHIFVFNATLICVCVYAFVAGGGPERATACVFLIAAAASYGVMRIGAHFEPRLVLIDFVALLAISAIALTANRFWPIHAAALQLITLAIHGVKLYDPSLAMWMWIGAASKLAYPILLLLAIGVARHRARVAEFGVDRPWSIGRTGLS